jgi:hypothetical protein
VTQCWGREITGGDEAARIAGHVVTNDGTDLHKVGFVFSRRVMLMEMKVVRKTSR